jgi:hypothetical protein
MTNEFEGRGDQSEPAPPNAGKNDRLFWRASLGQATYELLAAERTVTVEALIAHLEGSAKLDHLVLTSASTRAAIELLRSLGGRGQPAGDARP